MALSRVEIGAWRSIVVYTYIIGVTQLDSKALHARSVDATWSLLKCKNMFLRTKSRAI